MNIFRQRALHADGFAQSVVVNVPLVNALASLPQHATKLTKTFEQRSQILFLNIFAGTQSHRLQLSGGDFTDAGNFPQR